MSLTIEKSKAKKLFNESPEWFKQELISEFGEDTFKPLEYESIKSFEDACKKLGITNESCRPIFDDEEEADEIAYKKLKVIIAAINNGWKPDWNNSDQRKWWPWFNLSSGFGFSFSGYSCDCTHASVGSHLCFESEEKSNYCAQQFIDLYKDFLTITK